MVVQVALVLVVLWAIDQWIVNDINPHGTEFNLEKIIDIRAPLLKKTLAHLPKYCIFQYRFYIIWNQNYPQIHLPDWQFYLPLAIWAVQYMLSPGCCQTSNTRCTKSQNLSVSRLVFQLSSIALKSIEARCQVESEDVVGACTNRCCSNYIWVINNFIAFYFKVCCILEVWGYICIFCCFSMLKWHWYLTHWSLGDFNELLDK